MPPPRYRLRFAAGLVLFAALAGCAPSLVSPGTADAASEQTTPDEVVDDNKIEIALNKLMADDSAELWKDHLAVSKRLAVVGGEDNE